VKPKSIFSGDYSRSMWDAINSAKTNVDLRDALYLACCRLQELESRLNALMILAEKESIKEQRSEA
jgi:hypothetical protein